MEKADFLYFEFEDPNGINLIMFWDCNVKFSVKITQKLRFVFEREREKKKTTNKQPFNASNRDYSTLIGSISHRVTHKTGIFL